MKRLAQLAVALLFLAALVWAARKYFADRAQASLPHYITELAQIEVLLQFLVEAVVLSTLGGVIGIGLGLGGSLLVASALHLPFVFLPGTIVIAFAFSALVGVIFGYLPAHRAAGLNPIDALRHE